MYLLVKVELRTFDKRTVLEKGTRKSLEKAEELRMRMNQKYIDEPFYFITLKKAKRETAEQRVNEYQGIPIERTGQ